MSSGDFVGGSASFLFTGDDKQFQRIADGVEKKMQKVSSFDFSPVQAQFDAVGKNIDQASERVFRFGLRLGIVGRLSTGLGQMGRAAEEMSIKFRTGEASAGALFEKISEGIPIIGGFITAGRGIRELIDGEQAYAEVIKKQTDLQNERTAATQAFLDTIKKVERQTADLTKKLTQPAGVAFDLDTILTGGTRKAQDLRGHIDKEFKDAFDRFAKLRKEFGEKLERLQKENQITSTAGAPGGERAVEVEPDPQIAKDIADTERILSKIDERTAQLRAAKDKLEAESRSAVGFDVSGEVFKRLGEEAVKGVRTAVAAIDSYIPHMPKMAAETAKAVDGLQTDFDRFGALMVKFRRDVDTHVITSDTFNRISFDALFKTAAAQADTIKAKIEGWLAPLQQFGDKVAAGFQAGIDAQTAIQNAQLAQLDASAALGNRESKTAADRIRAEQQVFDLRKRLQAIINNPALDAGARRQAQAEIEKLPGLQASLIQAAGRGGRTPSFELPADMGRRIQQAAFGADPTQIQQQQLDELKGINRGGQRTAGELKKMGELFPKLRTVK